MGRLDLAFEAFPVVSDPGLTLTAYTALPATPAADGLALLASWTATQDGTGTQPYQRATDPRATDI